MVPADGISPFDHCVITASDDAQAQAFRELLDRRIAHGLYPREIQFHVFPDPPGRVGSGAGTLWALHLLYRKLGIDPRVDLTEPDAPSVLVLHAAGESRRLPVYAPEGKLFAPVPVASSSVIPPVVLDVQLSLFLRFLWEPGLAIVGSGDVVIDFDVSAIGTLSAPITGFAAPASLEQGSRHGVFAFDPTGQSVTAYYQKEPVSLLWEKGRLEGTDRCALDIGIVAMQAEYQRALFALANQPAEAGTLLERIGSGSLAFSLYEEQLAASLAGQSASAYLTRLDGRSVLSPAERQQFHDSLSAFPLGGKLTRNCTFLHLGSVADFPHAAAELSRSQIRPFYSHTDSEEIAPTGASGTALVEGMAWPDSDPVPDGFCIDSRSIAGVPYTAVYHAKDSFRPTDRESAVFCGYPLSDWLAQRRLQANELGFSESLSVSDLPVFCATADPAFIKGYFQNPDDPESWRSRFLAAERVTLSWLNADTDPVSRDEERTTNRARTLARQLAGGRGWRAVSGTDLRLAIAAGEELSQRLLEGQHAATQDELLRQYRTETLRYATDGTSAGNQDSGVLRFVDPGKWVARTRGIKRDQIVWARSPVRLDLAGGWTDTPPYTNLYGGAVTNVSVDLNGQPPIQVFIRPAKENHLVFHSIDLGVREVVTSSQQLSGYDDPGSGFSLPKAACSLLGLAGDKLPETLNCLGGGFEMSLLAAVPKGSGLGTSSILGGVILAALLRYFGIPTSLDEVFLGVLELEQMLTTGGGWQDQIGGLAGGVKYITSARGTRPHPLIHQLDPYLFEEPQFARCLTLYYTGVTRLARNILQDVVSQVNCREPAYLFTHATLIGLAGKARRAIELRDSQALARVVRGSWEANKRIHSSTTNEEMENLLSQTKERYAGAKLLGAGGGGYALFMSRSAQQADELREQLALLAAASDVSRLVDFSLSRRGLEVSVS